MGHLKRRAESKSPEAYENVGGELVRIWKEKMGSDRCGSVGTTESIRSQWSPQTVKFSGKKELHVVQTHRQVDDKESEKSQGLGDLGSGSLGK